MPQSFRRPPRWGAGAARLVAPSLLTARGGSIVMSQPCGTVRTMAHTPGFPEGLVDEQALRIRELIVGCCVASEPVGALLQVRAELLTLAEMTGDREAVDAACGAVTEIDAALAVRDTVSSQRRAS